MEWEKKELSKQLVEKKYSGLKLIILGIITGLVATLLKHLYKSIWAERLELSLGVGNIQGTITVKNETLKKLLIFLREYYFILLVVYFLIWITALILLIVGLIKWLNACKEIEIFRQESKKFI